MTPLRIGFNIHNKARGGQERSAEEKSYLPQFLRQLNPSAIVVMDDLGLAQDLYSALPNTIVCYRQSNPAEGHLWKAITPEQYVINQNGITKPGMPLYVLNEPDSKQEVNELRDRCKWLARVIELLAIKGCIAVVDNEGPGQPALINFTDDVRWQASKPLFDAFKRYPQMYWGLHPYWTPDGLHPEYGQSAIHRNIEPLLRQRGYGMPNLIFTETGQDTKDGGKGNGWKSTGKTEETYAAEFTAARNTLWTEPYIRGACCFCYGSSTTQWLPFDTEQAKILHSSLITLNATVQPAPPIPPAPIDVQALKLVRDHLSLVSNRTRQMSLELATISDDLLKDIELIDALMGTKQSAPPAV